ncbi:MAG: hypothetical protein HGA45_37685 [Chloroflexales bacterium]|nr:hypothetical protein [Chloroflexales bacterium]
MATIVLIVLAAVLALVLATSARKVQQAPVRLYIERAPRRIRRRDS